MFSIQAEFQHGHLWCSCFFCDAGIGSVSHFMSCCRQNPGSALGAPLDPPASVPTPAHWPPGVSLDTLGLARMPRRKDGTTVSDHSSPATTQNTIMIRPCSPQYFFMFILAFRLIGQLTFVIRGISVKKEHMPDWRPFFMMVRHLACILYTYNILFGGSVALI